MQIKNILGAMITLSLLVSSHVLTADQTAVTDDGREVVLKPDGSWEFSSSDRFASTEDGQRIRLKDDGSWQYVGNAPMVLKDQVKTTHLAVTLQKVVIETQEIKVKKNKRVRTQTVFYLDLALSPAADGSITVDKAAIASIEVKDDKGMNYAVLSIDPIGSLKPGTNTTLTVRADGSPEWLSGVKFMAIVLKPGILGIREAISLSRSVGDFDEIDVDSF